MDTKLIESAKNKAKRNGARPSSLAAVAQKVPAQAKQLEQRAEVGLKKAAHSATALAKKHPAVTAGALVGAGVLVGVVAQRALHHDPTVGEAVMSAIKRSASKVSKRLATTAAATLSAGKSSARRALR